MEGWIKLYRKLIENPIFLKPELLQLFIYCLLKANHEAQGIIFNGQEIEIKLGQFITGRNAMAKDLKQNPITTYKRLKILENLQILNIKSNNKFSVVTVVNYGLYQSEEIKRNTKRNNKGTTREQQGNTNKNDKNDKNDKKYKIIRSPIEIAIDDFKEFRKKIKKPMTDRAVELLVNKLNKLASDDETKIAMLNQSIVNGWQGVFPLKGDTQRQSGTNNIFLQEGV